MQALQVASNLSPDRVKDYLLQLDAATEEPDVTPLKLQKLMYYAQALYLAATGERLFDADIEAWDHGPVVNRVFAQYAGERDVIVSAHPDAITHAVLPHDAADFLDRVWAKYGGFSSSHLREMTHHEAPYTDNYIPGQQHTLIPDRDMVEFFHSRMPSRWLVLHEDVTLLTQEEMDALETADDEAVPAIWQSLCADG